MIDVLLISISAGVFCAGCFHLGRRKYLRVQHDRAQEVKEAQRHLQLNEEDAWSRILDIPESLHRTPELIEMVRNTEFVATREVRGMFKVELITPRGGKRALYPIAPRHTTDHHTEDPMIRINVAVKAAKFWLNEMDDTKMVGSTVFRGFVKDML